MNMQHLNNAGKLDLDFGKNGVMRIEVPGHPEIYISSVGIGPDGKIYFAGISTPSKEKAYTSSAGAIQTAAWTVSLVMRAL